MPTAKVTSKGQVTIPAEVRAKLGLRTGSRLAFVAIEGGGFEIRAERGSVRDLKGVVSAPAVPASLEEMDTAIAESAVGIDPAQP